MPPAKMDFDLTDRGWVDLYVKRCESVMKEFTNYVYALQNHCVKESNRCEQLDTDCKRLQTIVKKFTKEEKETLKPSEPKCAIYTPKQIADTLYGPLGVTEIKTPLDTDADRTTIGDGSPAFLNMAMDSEQLQMEASCVLSPAQQRQEIIPATEQLSSPNRLSIPMDSIFQHNTSPTCKQKNTNENKSALGFLRARGRVGKVLNNEPWEYKLREHNKAGDGDDADRLWKNKGMLQAKCSDWLGKDAKSEERRGAVKRAAAVTDDIQRKRGLLSLNKSGERKLRQSRLTQLVRKKSNKAQNESVSNTPECVADVQKFPISPSNLATSNIKRKLDYISFPSNTDDIFDFSSDDDDEQTTKSVKANTAKEQNYRKSIDATFLQPLPLESEKSDSVLAISPTAPPIICLDESENNEQGKTNEILFEKDTRNAAGSKEKRLKVKVKQEKSTTQKLPTELAAAMLAEWEEDDEDEAVDELCDVKFELPLKTLDRKTTLGLKPRRSQLTAGKISIKDCFNIDCDECQKYIDFMGSNMSLAEIEAHLLRCTRHRTPKDCMPVTPPDYWNPLMASFSESDPRNKTLLVDPCPQSKRYGDKL